MSPRGRISFLLRVALPAKVSISETGPILPTYMINDKISFVIAPVFSETPAENPVVEKEETTSNKISRESVFEFMIETIKVPIIEKRRERHRTVRVL